MNNKTYKVEIENYEKWLVKNHTTYYGCLYLAWTIQAILFIICLVVWWWFDSKFAMKFLIVPPVLALLSWGIDKFLYYSYYMNKYINDPNKPYSHLKNRWN